MRVRVLLFGPLAEMYGVREEWLELGAAASAADVYHHYRQRDPRIGQLEKSLHLAVNQTVVSADHALAPGDEVALLPPVCGGSGATNLPVDRTDLIDLVDTPLEGHPWRKHLSNAVGNFGAIASFEGLVRRDSLHRNLAVEDLVLQDSALEHSVCEHIQTGPVIALAFDAYRSMALSALRSLAKDARQRWPVESLVLLHRLGTVPAGEVCVVVAVATGHRDQAFAACKFLIDTLKATVPIWKKEIAASTSQWVEGVMLPGAIANKR